MALWHGHGQPITGAGIEEQKQGDGTARDDDAEGGNFGLFRSLQRFLELGEQLADA
jgi:hypothetical protein